MCWQVRVSAKGQSLVQKYPVEGGVSECDIETSTTRKPRFTRGVQPCNDDDDDDDDDSNNNNKYIGKVHPRTGYEGPEG
jgi:hypothetical protein